MAAVTWIKLNTQIFEDEKISLIEARPDGEALLMIWLKLLVLAGRLNASGYISFNENTPYSIEMLATVFRRPEALVRLAIATFQQFGMVDITEDKRIYISNWEKHQSVERLDRIREQDRIRKQRQRERERSELKPNPKGSHVTGHVSVTLDHALEIEKRKEKEQKEKYLKTFSQFWDAYPRKVDKKKAQNAFLKVLKKHTFETVIEGTEKYAKQVQNTEKQFIKHPATFLNNESFIDGYEKEGVSNGKNEPGETFAQAYGLDF